VEKYDEWFKLRRSASGEISAIPLMKWAASVRVLAYGCSADVIDYYVRIGEDTLLEDVRRFTRAKIDVFSPELAPNEEDTERLLVENEERDGLECLDLLTSCNRHGRIVQLDGNVSTKALQGSNNHS
jgi:hypothetical protein